MKYQYKTCNFIDVLKKESPEVDKTVEFLLDHEYFLEVTRELEEDGYEFVSFNMFLSTTGGSFCKGLYRKKAVKVQGQEDCPLSFAFSGQTLEEYINSTNAEIIITDENGDEVLED